MEAKEKQKLKNIKGGIRRREIGREKKRNETKAKKEIIFVYFYAISKSIKTNILMVYRAFIVLL
jgi:hypothetical protein